MTQEQNLGPTNSALLARNAQLQNHIQRLEALAQTPGSKGESSKVVEQNSQLQTKVQVLEARIKKLEAEAALSPEPSTSTAKRKGLEPKEEVEDKVSLRTNSNRPSAH